MTVRYRTTDLDRWGIGLGFDLPAEYIDENFYSIEMRVQFLEELPGAAAGIQEFQIDGDQLTVIMDDYTVRGPYTLPVVLWQFTGAWEVSHEYISGDIFTINGSLYIVRVTHTSALTFDAGATDGDGNDLYGLLLTMPSGALPAGGAAGQFLVKTSSVDYAASWTNAPIPSGGTAGQKLVKTSSTDYDTQWEDTKLETLDDYNSLITKEHGHVLKYDGVNSKWKATRLGKPQDVADSILTLGTEHLDNYVRFTGGGCIINVPLASTFGGALVAASGQEIHLRQSSAGGLLISGAAGVTINCIEGYSPTTSKNGAVVTLKYVGADEWDLFGLLDVEVSES